jgi:hypothetical protein
MNQTTRLSGGNSGGIGGIQMAKVTVYPVNVFGGQ